jgi:Amt family ammonium transporter
VTPAAGYISPLSAIALGAIAAVPSYFGILVRSKTSLDDSLDVVAAHGLGGTVGALLTGVFAEKTLNGAFDGALFGNPGQVLLQGAAVLGAMFYSAAGTFVVLKLIGLVMPLRATASEEAEGLDITAHGEEAYAAVGGSLPAEKEAATGAAHPVLKPARADV